MRWRMTQKQEPDREWAGQTETWWYGTPYKPGSLRVEKDTWGTGSDKWDANVCVAVHYDNYATGELCAHEMHWVGRYETKREAMAAARAARKRVYIYKHPRPFYGGGGKKYKGAV